LIFRHDFDAALEHSRRAVELDPLYPGALINRGRCLRWSGRNEEAIRHLEEAQRLHPNLVPVMLHLGMARTNAGRVEEGMSTLRDAVVVAQNSSQIRALHAYTMAKAGHREEALRVIREIEADSARRCRRVESRIGVDCARRSRSRIPVVGTRVQETVVFVADAARRAKALRHCDRMRDTRIWCGEWDCELRQRGAVVSESG
jgi:tetratricopeptide (TPR) repeat protein